MSRFVSVLWALFALFVVALGAPHVAMAAPSAGCTAINSTWGAGQTFSNSIELWDEGLAMNVGEVISYHATTSGSLNLPSSPYSGAGFALYTEYTDNDYGIIVEEHATSGAELDLTGTYTVTKTGNHIVYAWSNISSGTVVATVSCFSPPSTDATLQSLALSSGALNPAFTSGEMTYTASVPNTTASVKVTPKVTDARATITVNGVTVTSGDASDSIPLDVGKNTLTTVVTAEDGTTTKTYTVEVTRARSANADLSALSLSAGTLSPSFASDTTAYTASVPNATTSLTLTPTNSDANATVTVNGTSVTSGAPSGLIALAVGDNVVTTVVTAHDGTTKAYTVTVPGRPLPIPTCPT